LKVCPDCGKGFPDQYEFCTECGTRLVGARAGEVSRGPDKEEAREARSESPKRRSKGGAPSRVREAPEESTKPVEEPQTRERVKRTPQKKIGPSEVSWIEFIVGSVMIWVSILVMAVPSILFSVPAEIEEFFPEFFFFVFLIWVGFWVLRRGMEEGRETIGNAPKYSGLAVFVTLMVVALLRWNSGFSSADPTFWFRVAYLITMAIVGGKLLSMKKSGI
jgi:cation transport ATPase